jgi:hypothetical protein
MPMTRLFEAVPAELPAKIIAVFVPAKVGVPVIAPLAVFTLNPAGKLEAPKLEGLFDAVMV